MRCGVTVLAAAVIVLGVGCGGKSDPPTYRIGGTVSGLPASASLVLRNNGGDDLTVTANGAFAFATRLLSGAAYAVTVQAPPAEWACTVTGGMGTVSGADVTGVAVACAPTTYAIGGTVSGLPAAASLVLRNNGGDDLTVSANGPFTFAGRLASGAAYAVTVQAAPAGQTCTVAHGAGTVAGADVASVAVACVPTTYAIGGTVSGLPASTSLVLRNNGGDDLTVSADGAFAFATRLPSGAAYEVAVQAAPAEWTCTVTGGTGTVSGADVAGVAVTCVATTYAVGGVLAGLPASTSLVLRNNGGDDLTVSANGPFTFAGRLASGAAYAVTVQAAPAGQTCTVADGAGTVAGADVTSVAVACVPTTYAIGGTVSGLPASTSLVLRNNGGDDLAVSANGPFAFATRLPSGAAYAITLQATPAGQVCTIAGASGTVAGAAVTSVAVTCVGVVVQSWQAPTSWGARWPDGPTMVQHAHFSDTGIVNDKGPSFSFVGGVEPAPFRLDGFGLPERTIYGGGPFPAETVNYQAPGADVLDLRGDMLVCAVVKPDFDPVDPQHEAPIFAKGVGNSTQDIAGGGWVLMQMLDSFCFHYEYLDGTGATHTTMAFTPTVFANQDVFGEGTNPIGPGIRKASPLNPSYLVVCAGRAGDQISIAVNSFPDAHHVVGLAGSSGTPIPGPYALDAATVLPATIGGYAIPSSAIVPLPPQVVSPTANHVFEGRVYETAVWAEPATEANLRAKLALMQGLPPGASYTRNREASYLDGSGRLHTTYRNGPRIDPARGLLFGLQGWNRVSYWQNGDFNVGVPMVYAAGEDLTLWTKNGAAMVTKDASVRPPGDSTTGTSRVMLPAGDSVSLLLDNPLANPNPPPTNPNAPRPPSWDDSGPIQGQLWLRVPAATSGTLRVRKTRPAPSTPTADHQDIDLGSLAPGTWTRVALTALTADGTWPFTAAVPDAGTLYLENVGGGAVTFNAWGVHLTQIGGGRSNYDPGPVMYDWGTNNDVNDAGGSLRNVDVLQLPPVPASTAATGFCLSVDAQMPSGLPWAAPFNWARTALTWASDAVDATGAPVATVQLYVDGNNFGPTPGQLCLTTSGVTSPVTCAPLPAAWDTDGLGHNVKACVSSAGQVRLYDGDTGSQLGGGASVPAASVPDLAAGRLLVGNSDVRRVYAAMPWHGYVSRAAVCRDIGDLAACR